MQSPRLTNENKPWLRIYTDRSDLKEFIRVNP
jgi:hypothetical protein